jgi:hypothetical protein
VICRIYHKRSAVKKTPMSSIDIITSVGDLDQRSTSFHLPMQFPMGSTEFTIDPTQSIPSYTRLCPSTPPLALTQLYLLLSCLWLAWVVMGFKWTPPIFETPELMCNPFYTSKG